MKYNVEELRNKIANIGNWERETKKDIFNEMVRLLIYEAKVGVKFGNEELVLSVRPKGYLVSQIVAVKLGMWRGNHTILYRTSKKNYDIPNDNYSSSQTEIHPNGMALSAYVDLYESIVNTLKSQQGL